GGETAGELQPEEVLLKEVAIHVEVRLGRVGNPNPDGHYPKRRTIRDYADDGNGPVVDVRHAPDDCRVRVETIPPNGLADDRNRRLVGRAAVIGVEQAAKKGPVEALHQKEIAAHGKAGRAGGIVIADQRRERPVSGQLADAAVTVAKRGVFGV